MPHSRNLLLAPLAALLAGCSYVVDPKGETRVEGRAVVEATGQPVPFPELRLVRAGRGAVGGSRLPDVFHGDAQGRFSFRFQGEEGQRYDLQATAPPGYLALVQPEVRGGRRNRDLRPSCVAPAWVRIRLLDEPPRTLAMVNVTGYLGQDYPIRYPRDTTYVRQILPKDPNVFFAFITTNGISTTQQQALFPSIMDTVSVTFRF
ncbi:hypothetical protein GCM10027048_26050 [Hymenobacter coalescens]